MHLFFRTLLHLFLSRRAPRIAATDVASITLRVLPTDLDVLGHLNNGVYLSMMDLGRMDLMVRAGAWSKLRAEGVYPVMASETISFRKSLEPWQRFDLETRLVGMDALAVYCEQRFVVDGEIYASAMTRGRFLRRGRGVVKSDEVAALLGVDAASLTPPEWVQRWASDVALPSTRAEAPNIWD
ncbi:acyl-CoA thioesterase FadM [Microbacteriaceae bacterium SG_E_30_P1]|uniref:Acyl-CoA thioesterase FadM n=1 Tax=Antiquaquibacter oligotrophicus TaxID=2880260 RepID=A0ABT6KQI3_9MICO|nr:acyl-CoA thioesterase [Antiquaquibacter oligotrophicus]MDH6182242.1 acyl-CoA thioesterase FadM [Antiquaquibacter oligotrophicus]UDF12099.1 thioesterase family protein [Antiquaquibacter oligotrophicus]